MKLVLKCGAYVLLLFLAAYLFRHFRSEYAAANSMASALPIERTETNVVEVTTDPSTNSEAVSTNALVATNVLVGATNAPAASTNAAAVSTAGSKPALSYADQLGRHRSASLAYMAAFVVAMILLGGLGAWDFAHAVASRSHGLVFQENEGEERTPEYEAAEQEWSNGNYLEAIRQMRDYLKRHPIEQYVALRIAEIYEKDLANHVAAAMELEEVLNKRLPREKWGWTAIHLANIYSGRLNKPDQALSWLTRVVEHYPETAAARKARARLGLPEPEPTSNSNSPGEDSEAPGQEPEDESNLPKGFRPKK